MRPADSPDTARHTVPMYASMLIFAVLVPLLFWAAYHYYHDRHRPEPVVNLLVCIGLGVAASYLSRYLYLGLDVLNLRYDAQQLAFTSLPGLFAYAVLGIGLSEEFAKLVPFLVIVLRFKAFDEPMDGIVYGSFLALGFALVENLHYIDFLTRNEALARGFAGPLVHIVFASVWAYHIGLAKLQGRSVLAAAAVWLAVSAVLHGVYDFVVLGFSNTALLISAAIIVSVWLWRLNLIRKLTREATQ